MNMSVVKWATQDRRTGRYLRRGFSWSQDRWVCNAAEATLDERRSDWAPARGERRVKVQLTAQVSPP